LGLWWCRRTGFDPIRRLVAFVEQQVAPIFAPAGPGELALVAAAAGIGEELLFRGVLQPALAAHVPTWIAVALVGALFGLVHWLTPAYALLAGIVGVYLGALLALSGNLLVPIVAHALYDFFALVLLKRVKPTSPSTVL
jgi:membrane protease YdiL (CAAX protease family)